MPPAPSPASFSPIQIFLGADAVVKGIVVLLIIVSIASWAIAIDRVWRIAAERRLARALGRGVVRVQAPADLRQLCDLSDSAASRVLRDLADEWQWSEGADAPVFEETRERLRSLGELAVGRESARLAGRSSLLATVGSTAPFVGLFGTVWGIIRSFVSIGQTQDTSLAVVAPGIAEALFATAIGLACAIPAVIGYNRLANGLNAAARDWRGLAVELEVAVSRRLQNRARD